MRKFLRRLGLYGVLPGLCLIMLAICVALWMRDARQAEIREARAITDIYGIDELSAIELGDSTQWIQIRGRDTSNPVLLYLHGGPCAPMMPMGYTFQDEWEKHFTVVHWDQRESGMSFTGAAPLDSYSVDQYVEDTLEVVEYLRHRFRQDKIVLLGHSWGSILGVHAIQRKPEWFSAYIGVGQVVNMIENEKVSFEYAYEKARIANHGKALRELKSLMPYAEEITPDKVLTQRRWLLKFGGSLYGQESFAPAAGILWHAPEYSLRDVVGFLRGSMMGIDALWEELMAFDIAELGTEYRVPVLLFSGRFDYQVPSTLNHAWFESISAPHKEYVWFEEACHVPMAAQPERFAEELVARVLPLASDSGRD